MKAYKNKIVRKNKAIYSLNFLLSEKIISGQNKSSLNYRPKYLPQSTVYQTKDHVTFPFYKNISTTISNMDCLVKKNH
jgi:hypothetical protein